MRCYYYREFAILAIGIRKGWRVYYPKQEKDMFYAKTLKDAHKKIDRILESNSVAFIKEV